MSSIRHASCEKKRRGSGRLLNGRLSDINTQYWIIALLFWFSNWASKPTNRTEKQNRRRFKNLLDLLILLRNRFWERLKKNSTINVALLEWPISMVSECLVTASFLGFRVIHYNWSGERVVFSGNLHISTIYLTACPSVCLMLVWIVKENISISSPKSNLNGTKSRISSSALDI